MQRRAQFRKARTVYTVRPRRVAVVDEERGTTWGVYNFNHRGLLTIQMRDGSMRPSYAQTPQTMVIAEVFKLVKKGKIRNTIAVGTRVPYAAGDDWAGGLCSQSRCALI